MSRVELLSGVENSLRKLGLIVSEPCSIRPSCFDFAARKKDMLVLIKLIKNLGTIPAEYGSELRLIAQNLSAAPIFVGLPTPKNHMENDAAYSRHGIHAVTLETLLATFVDGKYPLVEARPGGFYVQLDKGAIQARRKELGLSLGELASMISVSRRTVYGYEHGLAKATVSTALRLETVLGVPIVRHIDIFELRRSIRSKLSKQLIENPFLHKVLRKLDSLGLLAAVTRKAPFDFIISDHEGRKILGGAVTRKEKIAEYRMRVTVSVAKVTRAKPLFIVEHRLTEEEAQTIRWDELKKFRVSEELLEIFSYK